jgi:hypothetical protein
MSESAFLQLEIMVGVRRFELPTSRSRTVRSSLAELHPECLDYICYELRRRTYKRRGPDGPGRGAEP